MSKQLLIPARNVEDADDAIRSIPNVAERGDEVVVLIVAEVPDAELVGTEPPPVITEPFAGGGTGFQAPRAPSDQPVFVSSERLMELKGREMCEALSGRIEGLHNAGFEARVEAMFSDTPAETIRDLAGDLDTRDVYVTGDFYEALKDEDGNVARPLPAAA